MKKIPTLFERVFENHRKIGIKNVITPGMSWVLEGQGTAAEKIDGACCAVIDSVLYRRYDAKRGGPVPAGAVPCCEPDPITGHWPHWLKVNKADPGDKWFIEAYRNAGYPAEEGTYEAIGPHFRSNAYNLDKDIKKMHMVAHKAECSCFKTEFFLIPAQRGGHSLIIGFIIEQIFPVDPSQYNMFPPGSSRNSGHS